MFIVLLLISPNDVLKVRREMFEDKYHELGKLDLPCRVPGKQWEGVLLTSEHFSSSCMTRNCPSVFASYRGSAGRNVSQLITITDLSYYWKYRRNMPAWSMVNLKCKWDLKHTNVPLLTFSCLLDKLTTRRTAVLQRAANRAKAEEKLLSLMRCSITERRRL